MLACALRFFFVALAFGILFGVSQLALGSVVSEVEPNNELSQPNQIQCGDTVLCASVPLGDFDCFRFLAPGGDSLYCRTFSCEGSDTDTYLMLFTDDLQIVDYDDCSGPMDFSTVKAWVPQSAYYRVRVIRGDQVHDADSTYSLAVTSRSPVTEAYDFCETARNIPSLPYFDEGDTFGKTDDIGTDAPDVFYLLHQPAESDVRLQVCSPSFHSRVQLLGYCMGNYMDDASSEDSCTTLITYSLQPGDYYILVEGLTALDFGEYTLEVSAYYPDCQNPMFLVIFPVGGQPALDWLDVPYADYYLIMQSPDPDGPFEYFDMSPISYYVDPTGFAADKRFYQVITVCPWSR